MRRRRDPDTADRNQNQGKINWTGLQDQQDAILVANHDNRNARRGLSHNNLPMLYETADKRRWTQILYDIPAQTSVLKKPFSFAFFANFAVKSADYLLTH
jgi:hypothetical protein